MAAKSGTLESPDKYRPYFVVSYAHSPTIAEHSDADPDRLVSTFFGDLEDAVGQYATSRSGPIHGFYDQRIPSGSDWKESLSQALSTAQVFVPLYSVGYFAKSLPAREWAFFRRRVELAGLADPESRFMPVLWTPLSGTPDPPGLRKALALGADKPGYVKNGLRPMLKIRSYHDSYHAVIDLLAKGIVALAEEPPMRPINPSEVSDIDDIKGTFTSGSPLAVFAIETATPPASVIATGADPRDPATSDAQWFPFAAQERSLTQYASQVVERFDFQAAVSEIQTVSDPRTRRPGIILIAPRFIADEEGRSSLISAVHQLPSWVLPLVILDQPGDPRTRDLADQVKEILSAARALTTESSRRAARGVGSLSDFLSVVPVLVAEAERQYLRYRSGRVPSQPSARRPSLRRPRLEMPAPSPDRPASAQDSLGETPDA